MKRGKMKRVNGIIYLLNSSRALLRKVQAKKRETLFSPGLVPMRLSFSVHRGLLSLNVASMPFMHMLKRIASPAKKQV